MTRLPDLVAIAVFAVVLPGVFVRVKALASGRRGAPILQLAFDVLRLVRKSSVYSRTTTPIFRVAPYVALVTAGATALLSPMLGGPPVVSFRIDFVFLAYAWGLGRVAVMLAAMDTGSSFEGMGAAREATLSAILEPALFLIIGALCLSGGGHTLYEALAAHGAATSPVVRVASVVGLAVVLQVEAGRVPVDDPTTHLELTMIHEVMILDHSGRELAALQLASALKLAVLASAIATLVNPCLGPGSGAGPVVGAALNVALTVAVVVAAALVESTVARLRMRSIPQYLIVALSSGVIALLSTAWQPGGAP